MNVALLEDIEVLCNRLGVIADSRDTPEDKDAIAIAAMAIWFVHFQDHLEDFEEYLNSIERNPQ